MTYLKKTEPPHAVFYAGCVQMLAVAIRQGAMFSLHAGCSEVQRRLEKSQEVVPSSRLCGTMATENEKIWTFVDALMAVVVLVVLVFVLGRIVTVVTLVGLALSKLVARLRNSQLVNPAKRNHN
ncbi:uncharacterized protein BDCG_16224 [Blastomyces dermatitidis ER-3]|uniref:Uncharacterized protein n=2 Tax=Ajellomyces dermatitidis TaxID=5039 RepID=A0A0J9ELE9_AJEDA|nr:uncharacterized protein BDCG_16224 [Blastomyces dermatitidis ER-3]KMW67133.1 hypothetical protein BDDG_11935 [Blastomyces dermatitidis ATCC 18188]OAS99604.1 hypothetical protein BDCG_16224 [Blastomyces dermatitidis ER-3]